VSAPPRPGLQTVPYVDPATLIANQNIAVIHFVHRYIPFGNVAAARWGFEASAWVNDERFQAFAPLLEGSRCERFIAKTTEQRAPNVLLVCSSARSVQCHWSLGIYIIALVCGLLQAGPLQVGQLCRSASVLLQTRGLLHRDVDIAKSLRRLYQPGPGRTCSMPNGLAVSIAGAAPPTSTTTPADRRRRCHAGVIAAHRHGDTSSGASTDVSEPKATGGHSGHKGPAPLPTAFLEIELSHHKRHLEAATLERERLRGEAAQARARAKAAATELAAANAALAAAERELAAARECAAAAATAWRHGAAIAVAGAALAASAAAVALFARQRGQRAQ
jgi:hypothetical protein